jgi:hypothetical protein
MTRLWSRQFLVGRWLRSGPNLYASRKLSHSHSVAGQAFKFVSEAVPMKTKTNAVHLPPFACQKKARMNILNGDFNRCRMKQGL